jgi:hypothetical protein
MLYTWVAAGMVYGLVGASVPAARADSVCTNFGIIQVGKYVLNNNLWGKEADPEGWGCIQNNSSGSPLDWSASYSWHFGTNRYGVKAYPSVISGWHWGTWSSNSSLPVRILDNHPVRTSGAFSVSGAGVQNAAFDCWFHPTGNPSSTNTPTDELMVWLARYGGAGPLGTFQGNATIAGATWAVYKGNVGWNVYSFVRATNANAWDFDLRGFVNHTVYTNHWMSPSNHLTSVQFGTEVFSSHGKGRLDVSRYRLDVE